MTPTGTRASGFKYWASPIVWGAAAGALWGLLSGSGAAPRASVAYDPVRDVVILQRPDLAQPITISASVFNQTYISNLVQVTLTFLILCLVGGWIAWQL